jgi:multicomponent Na+:H+ antiporter subunit C
MTANIGQIIYLVAVFLFLGGLYMMLTSRSYWRKIIGLSIFQNSILVFYVALGKVREGVVPIDIGSNVLYSSPVPHVLMLTAIVVGFATLSVGLALALRAAKNSEVDDAKP